MIDRVVKEISPTLLPASLATSLAYLGHFAVGIFHKLRGYTSPGTAPQSDPQSALDYKKLVLENWLSHLEIQTNEPLDLSDKDVLELGPGPDIAVGLMLLAKGARSYTAIDANPLVSRAPKAFYQILLDEFEKEGFNSEVLRQELEFYYQDKSKRLNYIHSPTFDLSVLAPNSYDLIISQAAFEHFDSPQHTIGQLSKLTNPEGTFLAQVDLKTHTPKLRAWDPLSIYRIGNKFYKLLSYPGVPNRVRPKQYRQSLKENGWIDIKTTSTLELSRDYLEAIQNQLALEFRGEENEMEVLSMYVYAVQAK